MAKRKGKASAVRKDKFASLAKRNDREKLYSKITKFPESIRDAVKIGEKCSFPINYFRKYSRVALLGMGASGAGGDFLSNSYPHLDFHTEHYYTVPPFFGEDTLVLAVTHSGKTEETISAAIQASRRKCPVIGIGGGEVLEQVCSRIHSPHLRIPLEFQPTRIGLGYTLFTPAAVLKKMGLIDLPDSEVEEIVATCGKIRESCAIEVPEERNPAKKMARDLFGKGVVVYGQPFSSAVSNKIKNDLAENAKIAVASEILPEANHNQLSFWQRGPAFGALMIRSASDESPEMKKRLDLTAKVLKKHSRKFVQLHLPEAKSRLARLVAGAYFGMFFSYYLGLLCVKSVEKTPLQVAVKNRMQKESLALLLEEAGKREIRTTEVPQSGQVGPVS